MKRLYFAFIAILLVYGCTREEFTEQAESTVLTVSLQDTRVTRTAMGESSSGKRKVYWTDGDAIALNGTASNPLSGLEPNAATAEFVFPGIINPPYELLYPASFYKDPSTITLPATQQYAEGTFAPGTAPLAGKVSVAQDHITIDHLCGILQLSVKGSAVISEARLKGSNGEQLCGDFSIDYAAPALTPNGNGDEITLNIGESIPSAGTLDLYFIIPEGDYTKGFTVSIKDSGNRTMTLRRDKPITFEKGKLIKMTAFNFDPFEGTRTLEIDDIIEEVIEPDGYNVKGRVVDDSGNGLEGVVVSDGLKSVRTAFDGSFYLTSDIATTKFVQISSPSGYLPPVVDGIPRFYKPLSEISPSGGVYDAGDFVITPVENPNRYTLLITADPQPRKNNWTLDKIAYKSQSACQDLYQELYDVSQSITGRQVYGICLGDIVHEDMSLYAQYNTALATLAYPTYNIIGNHDNDPSAADDDAGAATFESYYGPRNYSFNIGGIHFVMLDNLIMEKDGDNLTAYKQGLTDRIWEWLQSDMAFVPTTTKIMVCAHSPMYKQLKGSERTNSAYHAGTHSDKDGGAFGYADLFNNYPEIHAWAGHTHIGFNYVYPSTHRHKKVQVHTLARSTGELWTNEYLASGTPRGFTIVEVDNGQITWKFHPVTRQRGTFQGASTGYCSAGAPAYAYRDWSYDGSGVAVMKDGSGALTEDYQLHAYGRGVYGDDYVYANVFLWDEDWSLPIWTPDGGSPVTMTRLVGPNGQDNVDPAIEEKIYDAGDTEFRTWYKTYADKSGGSLVALPGYRPREIYSADGYITTIFRAPASASPSGGTVSVTDRFGNTYSRTISW